MPVLDFLSFVHTNYVKIFGTSHRSSKGLMNVLRFIHATFTIKYSQISMFESVCVISGASYYDVGRHAAVSRAL